MIHTYPRYLGFSCSNLTNAAVVRKKCMKQCLLTLMLSTVIACNSIQPPLFSLWAASAEIRSVGFDRKEDKLEGTKNANFTSLP